MDAMGRAEVIEVMGNGTQLCKEHMRAVDAQMVCPGCLDREKAAQGAHG